MKSLKIICCGAAQQWIGAAELDWPLHADDNVDAVLEQLAQRYPAFAEHRKTTAAACGERLLGGSEDASGLTELALIPPVSGG